jgi:hypothetical protein
MMCGINFQVVRLHIRLSRPIELGKRWSMPAEEINSWEITRLTMGFTVMSARTSTRLLRVFLSLSKSNLVVILDWFMSILRIIQKLIISAIVTQSTMRGNRAKTGHWIWWKLELVLTPFLPQIEILYCTRESIVLQGCYWLLTVQYDQRLSNLPMSKAQPLIILAYATPTSLFLKPAIKLGVVVAKTRRSQKFQRRTFGSKTNTKTACV